MSGTLFESFTLSGMVLKNRVVMAPMTRCRCPGNIPGELVATYYGQRSEAGLIVSEGTSPSPNGLGYARIPGLFSADQAAGWHHVAEAVHAENSRIFVQLMHAGRVGHPLNLPRGARLLAPSAVAAPGAMYTDSEGMQPHPAPRAMTEEEIASTIEEYVRSAELARQAGLDGVELHGANGYLIDQFLNAVSNRRTDRWGTTVQGRIRFAVEVARAVVGRIGANHVGIRISPRGVFNGMAPDDEHDDLFAALIDELNGLRLAYVHLVDHSSMGAPPVGEIKHEIRSRFKGPLILSGGYDRDRAQADLAANKGDLVAFGRPFISNPRLVSRLQRGAELITADPALFYTPGEQGYTDYPEEG